MNGHPNSSFLSSSPASGRDSRLEPDNLIVARKKRVHGQIPSQNRKMHPQNIHLAKRAVECSASCGLLHTLHENGECYLHRKNDCHHAHANVHEILGQRNHRDRIDLEIGKEGAQSVPLLAIRVTAA
ncbi:hypothetical protein ONZ51_g9610 [Trametes cubensis]|uniref:Uncharacterized protein n=1 Tax=Trametes cubensis TaxID=1111947 RepID=A0AAD7TM61_9APHY|nr:hypothetical protein ONZ51_g9610 [Trametes cubensis]